VNDDPPEHNRRSNMSYENPAGKVGVPLPDPPPSNLSSPNATSKANSKALDSNAKATSDPDPAGKVGVPLPNPPPSNLSSPNGTSNANSKALDSNAKATSDPDSNESNGNSENSFQKPDPNTHASGAPFQHGLAPNRVRLTATDGESLEVDYFVLQVGLFRLFMGPDLEAPPTMPPTEYYAGSAKQRKGEGRKWTAGDGRKWVETTAVTDKNSDGYRWRKYGQKLLSTSKLHREYMRCTFPDCPAKKHIEVVPATREVITVSSTEHNHPPVEEIGCMKRSHGDPHPRVKKHKLDEHKNDKNTTECSSG